MSVRKNSFGFFVRQRREELAAGPDGRKFSLRQVAGRVGFQPTYLSKVERDLEAPPSEEKILRLAAELDLAGDVLLAMAGKVSSDLREAVCQRPALFSELIRSVRELPDQAVLRLVREVRDGEW